MAGPVLPVDQQNVGPAVVVVVDESAAGAHGFGQPLFSEGSVVVGEVDAGLGGDVAEGDCALARRGRGDERQHQSTTETRRHGERRVMEFLDERITLGILESRGGANYCRASPG